LSKPHSVVFSDEVIEEHDIIPGEPVSFKVSVEGNDIPLAATARSVSDLDLQKEEHALFISLLKSTNELPEKLRSEFRESLITEEGIINLDNGEKLPKYLWDIEHQKFHSPDEEDVAIGIGLLEILFGIERRDMLETPFFSVSQELMTKCLNDREFSFEFREEEFEVVEPEIVPFCTHNNVFPDREKSKIKDELLETGYFVNGANYLFATGIYPIHGPVLEGGIPKDPPQIVKLNEDNIVFNSSSRIPIGRFNTTEPSLEDVYSLAESEFEEFEVEKETRSGDFIVQNDSYRLSFDISGESIQISIFHALKDEKEEITNKIESWTNKLNDELGVDVEASEIHQHHSHNNLHNPNWVLDTNIVYKQTKHAESTDICEYVSDEHRIYNKNILVPWQVIVEINRHKEESGKLERVSKRGLKNLKYLQHLDEFDYINLEIDELPQTIDNSIHPNTGTTDLGILSTVPENGVLLSNDERLIDLAKLFDINAEDIVKSTDSTTESDIWKNIESLLIEENQTEQDLVDKLDNLIKSESENKHRDRLDEPEDYVSSWMKGGRIIKYSTEEGSEISLSDNFEITPTYRMITRISENIREVDGENLLSRSFLENIRTSMGRLSRNELPRIEFVIPEQYVYRAKEADQVNE
jgi:hypothetical protein